MFSDLHPDLGLMAAWQLMITVLVENVLLDCYTDQVSH